MSRPIVIHPLVWVLALVAVVGAYRFGVARDQITTALALGVPAVLGVWGWIRSVELSDHARRWTQLSVIMVAAACELATWRAVVPPAPLIERGLSTTARAADLAVPEGMSNMLVELVAPKQSAGADAEGRVSVILEREQAKQTLTAEFHNHQVSARASKARSVSGQAVHDSERFHVALAGHGPVHARLQSTSGSMGKEVKVAVFDDPAWVRALGLIMALGACVGLFLVASRRVRWAGLAPALGILAAYGIYLPMHLGKFDRLGSILGSLIIAGIVGGVGALVLEFALRRFWPASSKSQPA